MGPTGRKICLSLAVAAGCVNAAQAQWGARLNAGGGPNLQAESEQVYALANQARAQAGVGRLQWDPALADAALGHCLRMAAVGPISHRYGGEAELNARAAQAGAYFDLIEENVAKGPSASVIHELWMESPGHRENLLSPEVDHVGVAVVAARGVLYAVADYSHAVQPLSAAQVEAHVAALVRPSGVAVLQDPSAARAACTTDEGMPPGAGGMQPHFIQRWQDADLSRLPQDLVNQLETRRYRAADVGSCPTQDTGGAFTAYRVAVILY